MLLLSMEESRSGGKDPCWKYSTPDPNDKNTVTCNFCGKRTKGGIFRAKKHLVGGFRDVKRCLRCPSSVREEIASFMTRKANGKKEMVSSRFPNNAYDFDYDESEDTDSDDEMLFKKIKSSTGTESSKGYMERVNLKGPMDAEHTTSKDFTVKDPRSEAVEKCAIWLITAGISFDLVKDESFQEAWDSICRCSLEPASWKPPSLCELRVVLDDEKKKISIMLNTHKEEWAKYGCTLILDGWHDEIEKKDILNVLVNSPKGMVFLMSKDVSNIVNDAQKLFSLLDRIVEDVGEENVVQVVTDQASPYAAAGKLLEMHKRHLFWCPCATQCIDLMLQDIGKIPRIRKAIKNAVFLNSYLYSHTGASNLLKKYTGKRQLMRFSVTRFATTFLTLKSFREQKHNLRKMVVSDDWRKTKCYKEIEGKTCSRIVLKESFWRDVVYAIKLTIPLMKVLALVYSDKPSMGNIYSAIDQAKEVMMKSLSNKEEKYKEAIEIIDRRWQCQLQQPLHAAGYFLNPRIFIDGREAILDNRDIMNGLHLCIERFAHSQDEKDAIKVELAKYQNAECIFGRDLVIRQGKTRSPVPHLKKFAVSILSVTCGATRYERNWDIFQKVHSKRITELAKSRYKKMLYVRYNLSLIHQHKYQNEIDPLLVINNDESNEWLVGTMEDATEDEVNEPHYLSWFSVADSFGTRLNPAVNKGDEDEEFGFDEEANENGDDQFDLELPDYSDDEDD